MTAEPTNAVTPEQLAGAKDLVFACRDMKALLELGTFPGKEAMRVANAITYLDRQANVAEAQLAEVQAVVKRQRKSLKRGGKGPTLATKEDGDGQAD